MKTCTASGIALADLARALDLDLEHDAVARGPAAARPRSAASRSGGRSSRVLEELARRDPALELLLGP